MYIILIIHIYIYWVSHINCIQKSYFVYIYILLIIYIYTGCPILIAQYLKNKTYIVLKGEKIVDSLKFKTIFEDYLKVNLIF